MALKGSLRDFGLSEILQLIGHQKKSGELKITGKGSEASILFQEGNIVSASQKPLPAELEWREVLVRSRMVSTQEFELAEKKSRETLQPLEVTLLKFKALSQDELKQMIRLRNLEIINSLFLLNEGEYEFETGPVSYIEQITDPINSEQVLMDGYRIKDEWPQIKKSVPSTDMRFAKKPGEFIQAEKLPEDEDRIFRMLGKDYPVQDLIFLSKMGKFETCRALARLLEKDLIQPVSAEAAPSKFRVPLRGRLVQALFYPAIIIMILLILNGIRLNLDQEKTVLSARLQLMEPQQRRKIEQALKIYHLAYGSYPHSLEQLLSTGLLSRQDFRNENEMKYTYENQGDQYLLESQLYRVEEE
jgi:hypothetical protein